jgi:hypothetical protein
MVHEQGSWMLLAALLRSNSSKPLAVAMALWLNILLTDRAKSAVPESQLVHGDMVASPRYLRGPSTWNH